MITRPLRRIVVPWLAACLAVGLMAGCSSSGSKTTGAEANATSTSQSTSSASATSSGNPDTATSDAATPSTKAPSKVGGGKFCQQLAKAQADTDFQDLTGDNPADLKKTAEEFKAMESSLLASAPSDIKADLSSLFGYVNQFYDALAKVNYDWTKVDPTQIMSIASLGPDVLKASQHVEQYVQDTCGIDVGGLASDSPPSDS